MYSDISYGLTVYFKGGLKLEFMYESRAEGQRVHSLVSDLMEFGNEH